MDPIDRFIESVFAEHGSDREQSEQSLRSTLSMVADCENMCAEFRALAKGMIRDKGLDLALYHKEQEFKGDEIHRCMHDAASAAQRAKSLLLEFWGRRAKGDFDAR